MLTEIYTFLEEYTGTSYDFDSSVAEIQGETAFVSPFEWRVAIENILNQLDDAIDAIDEHWRLIPPTMPNRSDSKRMLAQRTLSLLVKNIRNVCDQLNIDTPTMETLDQLKVVVQTLFELIEMLSSYELDQILKENMYETHEEENDDSFSNVLDVAKQDMTQLSFNVSAIRQAYYEALDTEEQDEQVPQS